MKSNERELSLVEKKVINLLQRDFGYDSRPFDIIAKTLEISVNELLKIMNTLKNEGYITRVGPFFNMDKTSGYVTLVAMKVSDTDFEKVADYVNSFIEVAHNYERDNEFNMWFVLASKDEKDAFSILEKIEQVTGYKTYNLPKLKEYALSLYLEV